MIGENVLKVNQETMRQIIAKYFSDKWFPEYVVVSDVHAENSHKKGSKDKFVITFVVKRRGDN